MYIEELKFFVKIKTIVGGGSVRGGGGGGGVGLGGQGGCDRRIEVFGKINKKKFGGGGGFGLGAGSRWYQDNSDLGQFGPSQFGLYFIRP